MPATVAPQQLRVFGASMGGGGGGDGGEDSPPRIRDARNGGVEAAFTMEGGAGRVVGTIEFHDSRLDTAAPWSRWPLFWFPLNVNAWGMRMGSFCTFVFAAVAVVFRENAKFKFFVAGICGDLCLR